MADDLAAGLNLRLVVHQASGMVSVRLGISLVDALARRLRFHEGELGR